MMVEAAEREVSGYIRRQPFRPRRSGAGPIAKKTPLQTDQFLGVKPVGDTGRVAGGVRDSILNGGKTRRARIAQIGRLHWRRPQREHSQPVAVRVSVQVDQDIATVGANQAGRLPVVHLRNRSPVAGGPLQPAGHRVGEGSAVIAERFKLHAVVLQQNRFDKPRYRMTAKIAGHVSDTKYAAGPAAYRHARPGGLRRRVRRGMLPSLPLPAMLRRNILGGQRSAVL